MAAKLDAGLRAMGVDIPNPTQANAVFPIFTEAQTAKLQENYRFYVWNVATGQVRLMCSWDTTEEDIDFTIDLLKKKVGKLRELSPLWDMYKDGIDISSIQWAAH